MSDLDRVLGRRVPVRETTTADIAPVMVGGGPGAKRPGLVKKKGDDKEKQRRRAISGVLGTLGESEEEEHEDSQDEDAGVIPKDAEEMEDGRHDPSGLNLKEPQFKKKAPDSPQDEREQLLSPKAALVAPDVTPDSMVEIDPSDVPGPEGETFRAVDTAPPQPPSAAPEPPGAGADRFTNTMDMLLGRTRSTAPAQSGGQPPPTMESAPSISPEAAAAMFTSQVGDPLRQGQPMPDPKVGDGKAVLESFRRFCG